MFDQRDDLHVVDGSTSQVEYRLRQVHGQSRIIELAVVIRDAALQPFGLERWNSPERLFP